MTILNKEQSVTTDAIQQKAALLSEELQRENIRSWADVLLFYMNSVEMPANSWLMPTMDLIQTILESGQQKLFRAGLQMHTLIISSKEDHGLYEGDYHIRMDMNDDHLAEVWYGNYSINPEKVLCDSREIALVLQPFLNRLWEDTHGRKAA